MDRNRTQRDYLRSEETGGCDCGSASGRYDWECPIPITIPLHIHTTFSIINYKFSGYFIV